MFETNVQKQHISKLQNQKPFIQGFVVYHVLTLMLLSLLYLIIPDYFIGLIKILLLPSFDRI